MRFARRSNNLPADNMSVKSSVSFLDRMPFRRRRESFTARSAIELPIHHFRAAERETNKQPEPVANHEEPEAQPEKAEDKTSEVQWERIMSFCLDVPETSTDFFPSSIVLSRPATAIPEQRVPQTELELATTEDEVPEIDEDYRSDAQIEIDEEYVFREFSGVSPSIPARSFSPPPSPSLVPEPLNVPNDSERTLSMNSIQPSIFHVHRRTPTIESDPDSLTSDSSSASGRSSPPPSTPISSAPTSPTPTFVMPSSPMTEMPTFVAAPSKTPEMVYVPAIARRSAPETYVPTTIQRSTPETYSPTTARCSTPETYSPTTTQRLTLETYSPTTIQCSTPETYSPATIQRSTLETYSPTTTQRPSPDMTSSPAPAQDSIPETEYAAPPTPRPKRTPAIAPTPDSPLVLTLTSKYPTGAAADLYIPEDVSLPRGVKPTTGGRLRAKAGFINLRKGTPKGGKGQRSSASAGMGATAATASTAAVEPARPSTSRALVARTATGLSALGKVSSEVGRAGSDLVRSNGTVLRKRPQSISSAFYY